MNELYALGSLSVRRDGEEAAAVLAQPKRAALLAYLALVRRGRQQSLCEGL